MSATIPEDSSLNEDLIEQIARWHLTGYHGLADGDAVRPLERNRHAVYQQHFLLSHAGLLLAIDHLHPGPEDRLHRRLDLVIVHAWERAVCWCAKLVTDLLEPRSKSIWTWLSDIFRRTSLNVFEGSPGRVSLSRSPIERLLRIRSNEAFIS